MGDCPVRDMRRRSSSERVDIVTRRWPIGSGSWVGIKKQHYRMGDTCFVILVV